MPTTEPQAEAPPGPQGPAGGQPPLASSEESAPPPERPRALSEPPQLTPLWALKAVYCVGIGSSACLWKFIVVFYHNIGLSNARIGFIAMCTPTINFIAQLFWAALCDWWGSYKEALAVSTGLGTAIVCCCLLPVVQAHFWLLCAIVLTAAFLMASRGSLNDSMTLQVVDDYKEAYLARLSRDGRAQEGEGEVSREHTGLPTFGEQRLWGAAGWGIGSLGGGFLMDMFGVKAMFISFAVLLFATVVVIVTQFPTSRRTRPGRTNSRDEERRFLSFPVFWFFANLFVYGTNMALVESFLFVYLVEDFTGTSSTLLGATTFVMCAFEVPVFLYFKSGADLKRLLSVCHFVFALRCVAYSLLPASTPGLVLLVEPLHGITFALMWCCSIEYGRSMAPPGAEAKMQALVRGIYGQLAQGFGSFIWGHLTEDPSKGGFGFRSCFIGSAITIVAWSLIWNLGWKCSKRRPRDAPLLMTAPVPQ